MAIMIPDIFEGQSHAEEIIFNLFRSLNKDGADNWTVIHSQHLNRHPVNLEGEIDFLVLAPEYGIFDLEVKGGTICKFIDKWTTKNHDGHIHKINDPFKQAEKNIYSFERFFKKNYPSWKMPTYWYGVMFPECVFELENENSRNQWQIFDKRDNSDVFSYIQRLSREFGNLYYNKYHYSPYQLTSKDAEFIVQNIVPTSKEISYNDYKFLIEKKEDEITQKLTEQQSRHLYSAINRNKTCIIQGLAGTGKTIIAINAAKHFLTENKKIAFFCYNTQLENMLQKTITNNNGSFIGRLHSFMLKQIENKGGNLIISDGNIQINLEALKGVSDLPIKYPNEVANNDTFWEEFLPKMTLEILNKSEIMYDVVLLDEAQDLFECKYFDVIDKILKGGLKNGHLCVFADPEQDITKKTNRIDYEEAIDLFFDRYERHTLYTNCRNTIEIQSEISKFINQEYDTYLSETHCPPVKYYQWSDTNRVSQKIKLIECLNFLIKTENLKQESITILSVYDPHVHLDWWEKSVISLIQDTYKTIDFSYNPKSLTHSTISRFKGCENTAIIIVDIDSYQNKNLICTGMSRARTILCMLETDKAQKERLNLQEETK